MLTDDLGKMDRLGQRRPVARAAELRYPARGRFGRAREITVPVTLLDVSVSGAALALSSEPMIIPGFRCELGVEGAWGRVRVMWIRGEGDNDRRCGVEFVDPRPAFLPTLYEWLEREAAVQDTPMRG